MKQLATLLLVLVAFASQAQTTCVDPLACNFTESGECIYVDENGDLCVVEGCNIEGACNYDPEADLNDGSCDFESCLGCTDETACNFDPEALYLDNSCIYYIDCNGTCGGDWIQDECGNCYAPNSFPAGEEPFSLELVPCGASGTQGPTQSQCDNIYGSGLVEVSSGIQSFQIEYSGMYLIEAAGAKGGDGSEDEPTPGGLGAVMSGKFLLEAGTILNVVVGQEGISSFGGGGGGGSFVWAHADSLLLVAGGGGGAGDPDQTANASGGGGLTTVNGGASGDGVGSGGTGGEGGFSGGSGGGGGGWLSSGQSGTYPGGGSFQTGFFGGDGEIDGGFGGGGANGAGDAEGGGGGGGYSGGGGGDSSFDDGGGGGGSYNIGQEQQNVAGQNLGDGYVSIVQLSAPAPPCELGCTTLQACNYNEDATNDDGTCDYCFCGPGTEYSVEAGQCLVVEGCTDFNDDGCTGTQDLLHLLSNFGNCDE